MKRTSLFVALLILFAGCDNSLETDNFQTESEDALSAQLNLSTEAQDFSAIVADAEFLIDDTSALVTPDVGGRGNRLATLGRVLFYEKQLSQNGTISCASCHKQSEGFSDSQRFSGGFDGELTSRQAMSVANVRFYRSGRMFWDERAESLEAQALGPIQSPVEMGLTLEEAVQRVEGQPYYEALFVDAFGDAVVTMDRIAEAIATFERAIVSNDSRYDEWLRAGGNNADVAAGPRGGNANGGQGNRGGRGRNGGPGGPGQGGPGQGGPNQGGPGQAGPGGINPPGGPLDEILVTQPEGILTVQEDFGRRLFFSRQTRCSTCHSGNAFVGDRPRNNGLDLDTSADQGAGNGRFKMASLRNIELTAPYMHDGRFSTLDQVVEFYNSGIQAHPDLDNRLTNRQGNPIRMNLNQNERDALVAFLKVLTDESLATEERFSDPFNN